MPEPRSAGLKLVYRSFLMCDDCWKWSRDGPGSDTRPWTHEPSAGGGDRRVSTVNREGSPHITHTAKQAAVWVTEAGGTGGGGFSRKWQVRTGSAGGMDSGSQMKP